MISSSGGNISGPLLAEALTAIRAAGLDSRRHLVGTTEREIKLAEAETISAAYSTHDFRHLYAVMEYRKDRDAYWVSNIPGHASIQVIEAYSKKGLSEVD